MPIYSNAHVNDKVLIDEVSASVTYIGYADPDSLTSEAVWKIKKVTLVGDVTSIQYADGTSQYLYVWDDRTTYTYS